MFSARKNAKRIVVELFRRNLIEGKSCILSSWRCTTSKAENEQNVDFWPPKFRAEYQLVDFFKNNVLYQNRNYIVCAKPYAVANGRVESEDAEVASGSDDFDRRRDELSISKILPKLAEEFDREQLLIARSVPRNVAGLVIFANTEEDVENVHDCIRKAAIHSIPYMKMLCICVGKPTPDKGEENFPIEAQTINNHIMHVVGELPENGKTKARKHKRFLPIRYRTLAVGNDCSVVEIFTRSLSWHCFRLFMAYKGSPILGDGLYQTRVSRVLGTPILVPPHNASIHTQYIPLEILKTLNVSLNEYHQLPMFAFVQEMMLQKMLRIPNRKPRDFHISVPMPEYFEAMLNLLFSNASTNGDN